MLLPLVSLTFLLLLAAFVAGLSCPARIAQMR